MKIAVAGTGYVGLVTGVALAHIGHHVTCVDIDEIKIKKMQEGISPIYEEGLEELMHLNKERLTYTTDYKKAYSKADVIFIGVGTPEKWVGMPVNQDTSVRQTVERETETEEDTDISVNQGTSVRQTVERETETEEDIDMPVNQGTFVREVDMPANQDTSARQALERYNDISVGQIDIPADQDTSVKQFVERKIETEEDIGMAADEADRLVKGMGI